MPGFTATFLFLRKENNIMGSLVCVVDKNGNPIMPTNRNKMIRERLRDGTAEVVGYHPFTVKFLYDVGDNVQNIELCVDTGYQHIGVSVKSDKQEFFAEQYDLLTDEKKKHDTQRKMRNSRRSRKPYREPRFNNRVSSKKDGWLAPSIKNKADRHIDIIEKYLMALPIPRVYIEVGEFDTQLLAAIQNGDKVPEGKDYQQGERYGIETLRKAVFFRDKHTCVFCGRSFKDKAKLHVHHALYWQGRHGNQLSELVTACEECHTASNHQKGGFLWGYTPKKATSLRGSAYMNIVRWYIVNRVKRLGYPADVITTYGAATKVSRQKLGNLEKSHINDAYAMGTLHPSIRAEFVCWQKRRRNNRILEKFYDARIVDIRDGSVKAGSELGCERTNRREPRNSEKSLRKYRGEKVKKGHRSIRKQRYSIRPGDRVLWNGAVCTAKGVQSYGKYVSLLLPDGTKKSVPIKLVTPLLHVGGWERVELKTTMKGEKAG
jgi:hypothetical protein